MHLITGYWKELTSWHTLRTIKCPKPVCNNFIKCEEDEAEEKTTTIVTKVNKHQTVILATHTHTHTHSRHTALIT